MEEIKDIKYNEYDECKLDFYIPDAFNAAIILFHGGGLVEGDKSDGCYADLAKNLAKLNYFVVEVNYRLMPKVKFPLFLNDAADAVKYVKNYLEENCKNTPIYIGGHSAGAYLSLMLCLKKDLLANVGMSYKEIAGWLIDSAQTTTHFNVLASKGLSEKLARIDESAPIYYLDESIDFNKMLLISYTDDIPCRPEQNALFCRTVKWMSSKIDIRPKTLEGGHCSGLTTYDEHGKSILVDIFDKFIRS